MPSRRSARLPPAPWKRSASAAASTAASETLNRSAIAATDALNRSAAEPTIGPNTTSPGAQRRTIAISAAAAIETQGKTTESHRRLWCRAPSLPRTKPLARPPRPLAGLIPRSVAAANEAIANTGENAASVVARTAASPTKTVTGTNRAANQSVGNTSEDAARSDGGIATEAIAVAHPQRH